MSGNSGSSGSSRSSAYRSPTAMVDFFSSAPQTEIQHSDRTIGTSLREWKQQDYLEPLKGPAKRKKFLVYDIESKDDDTDRAGFTRPFLVGMYDGSEYQSFRNAPRVAERPWEERHVSHGGCVDRFLKTVLVSEYIGWNIYAHAGGTFDHLHLLEWFQRHSDEFEFEVIPVQSSIQMLKVWPKLSAEEISERRKKKKPARPPGWDFLDSMKLIPMSLDRLAKTFGLEGKKEMDLHLPELHPSWEEYLKVDCLQLYEGLERIHDLVENKLGGEVGITTPSTSIKLFRRQFLGKHGTPKKLPRYLHFNICECTAEMTSPCLHHWIRRSYCGGRTENREMWAEGIRYYDFNSSYLASMREAMPVGDMYEEKIRPNHQIDWRMCEQYIGFVECMAHIPEDCPLPPLPHKSTKLMFPTGNFEGVWNTEELLLLKDPIVQGHISHIKRIVWFRKKKVFHHMVEALWRLRDKKLPNYDDGLSALGKLLGNGGYGKFAMKEQREQIVFAKHRDGQCFLCGKESDLGLCGECVGSKSATGDPESIVWYQSKKVDAAYIIPQIAAHITTLSRVKLWYKMRDALWLGGIVAYLDTDSMMTDVVIPSSNALGEMKDEYPGKTFLLTSVQPKAYMLEIENLSPEELEAREARMLPIRTERIERIKAYVERQNKLQAQKKAAA